MENSGTEEMPNGKKPGQKKAELTLPSLQDGRKRHRSGGSFTSNRITPLPPIKDEDAKSWDAGAESLDQDEEEGYSLWGSGRDTPKHAYHWSRGVTDSRASSRRSSVHFAELPSAQARRSISGTALTRRRMSHLRVQRRRSSIAPASFKDPAKSLGKYALDQALVDKAKRKGVLLDADGDFDIFDDITRLKQLDLIKQMPVNMTLKRKLRDKLYDFMPEDMNKGWASYWYRQKLACYKWKLETRSNWLEFRQYTTMWHGAFKNVEGHHGSGVVTYFRFLKWLLQLNFIIFLLVFCLLVIPQVAFSAGDYTVAITGGDTNKTSMATTCSAIYEHNVTQSLPQGEQDWSQYILGLLMGTGWMERTIAFYGFYDDRECVISGTSLTYNLPLAYLLVIIAALLVSLVLIVRNTARGFKERLLSHEQNVTQYCNQVYGGWDYSMTDPDSTQLRHKSIHREFTANMEEERHAFMRANRSLREKCGVYTIRFLINLFVAGVLGCAGYLIYYTTVSTASITSRADYSTFPAWQQLLIEFMTSLTITALNGIIPVMFKVIVRWEKYTPGTEVNITLIRTVFLRLASLAVLLASMYSEITCGSTKDDCGINTGDGCPELRCWESYVGQEMYKLVITQFLVTVAMVFFYEFPRRLIVAKCSCKVAQIVGYQEFDLPKNVLDLIYAQTLMWLGTLFAPMIPAVTVIELFLTFYLKLLTTVKNYKPGSKLIRASDSNQYFMIVLLTAYTLCVVPLIYVIWSLLHLQKQPAQLVRMSDIDMFFHVTILTTFTLSVIPVIYVIVGMPPSSGCGPFRIHGYMHDVFTVTLNQLPSWVDESLGYLSSAAFVIPILIILCLVIFYMSKVSSAYKDITNVLKDQLAMEGQDKQYLMRRIQDLTEGGDTVPPPPVIVTEENEKNANNNGSEDTEKHIDTPLNVPL